MSTPGSPAGGGATAAGSDAAGGGGPNLSLSPPCAGAGDTITVSGAGFVAGSEVRLRWRLPDGRPFPVRDVVVVSADGSFARAVEVRPFLADQAVAAPGGAIPLEATGSRPSGGPRLSEAVRTTADLLVETLLMALMASTFGALIAFPLAFVAARNLMPRTVAGNGAYRATRLFLNVMRAVEPIILAVIFALWVGFGSPFAGVLALTVVTVASLGKLFSEAIENVDAGPIEAAWATGARRLQMIAFAVVPQVVLAFLAFGIYHWDINVRMSTVVGFVGGGGIGFQLREWINSLQWGNAAVAILGIVIVVSTMDFLSARLRRELAAGGGDRAALSGRRAPATGGGSPPGEQG
jgi:phosphonate transport system permease protein